MKTLFDKHFTVDFKTGQLWWNETTNVSIKEGAEITSCDGQGYLKVRLNDRNIKLHRIIWIMAGNTIPKGYILDHINRNRVDNRLENLRLATLSNNAMNRGPSSRNTSGYKGVCVNAKRGRVTAQICIDKYYLNLLDLYDTPENRVRCAKAYDEAALYHYGEFAYLNFGDNNG
jgi:hypothetical protein